MNKEQSIKGWAWEIQADTGSWVLCWWLYGTRKELMADKKPSPEARAVRVEMRRIKP